jgi:short-subunit dehydrogenase
MKTSLKGKIAVITGAGGGLGNALVKQLEREGVTCILVEKKMKLLNAFVRSLDKNKKYLFECDFSKEDNVETLVEQIKSNFDKIDLLYNIAGIGIYKSIEDLSAVEWKDSLTINLTAPFILIKGLVPLLRKSDMAFVLNFGSGMGKVPSAGRVAYCASKFGLRGLSLSLSKEFEKENIDISLLTLGSIMTDFGPGGIEFRKGQEKLGKKYLDPIEVTKRVIEITISTKKREEYVLYPNGYLSL